MLNRFRTYKNYFMKLSGFQLQRKTYANEFAAF